MHSFVPHCGVCLLVPRTQIGVLSASAEVMSIKRELAAVKQRIDQVIHFCSSGSPSCNTAEAGASPAWHQLHRHAGRLLLLLLPNSGLAHS